MGDDAAPDAVVTITNGGGTDWIRGLAAVPSGLLSLDPVGRLRGAARCASGAEDLGIAVTGNVDGNVYVGGTPGGAPDCGGGAVPGGNGYMAWLASFTQDGTHR